MKRSLVLLIGLSLIFALAGCGAGETANQTAQPEETTPSNAGPINKVSEGADSPEADIKKEDSFTTINLGESITTDFVELTLNRVSESREMKPEDTCGRSNNAYMYMTDTEGETYLCLSGNLKNITGDSFDIAYSKILFTFDDTYNYDGEIEARSSSMMGGFEIEPLKDYECLIYKSIPDELIQNYKTCTIKIAFNENFEDPAGGQADFDSYDYRYEFVVTK